MVRQGASGRCNGSLPVFPLLTVFVEEGGIKSEGFKVDDYKMASGYQEGEVENKKKLHSNPNEESRDGRERSHDCQVSTHKLL